MQDIYDDDAYIPFLESDLKKLIQSQERIASLVSNDQSYKKDVVNQLKASTEALKQTQIRSDNSQQELAILSSALKDSQDAQAKLISNTNKIIKQNQNSTDPLAKQLVKQQTDIKQILYRAIRANASFRYTQKKWEGPIPSVKAGDSQASQAIKESVKEEGSRNKQYLKLSKDFKDLNFKAPTVAPVKTFNTLGNVEEQQSSFWESNGARLATVFTAITAVGASLANAMQDMTAQMGQVQSTMFSALGDILDNPVAQVISAITGISQELAQAFQLMSSIISSIAEGISTILSAQAPEKEGGGNIIGKIIQTIGGLITSLINMVVSQIQSGFSIFTSLLTAIFKILKKIQLSSPVIQQILDLLSLAFNLFFMPFMNAFGLQLLDGVVNILNWALDTGQKFSTLGQDLVNILKEQGFDLDSIMMDVTEIAVSFVKNYLPQILKLLPSITDFAVAFVTSILNHSQDILDFIDTGFKVFTQMLSSGVISSFLDFGKKVMEWLDANGENLMEFMKGAMNQALGLQSFFLGFIGTATDVITVINEGLSNLPQAGIEMMKNNLSTANIGGILIGRAPNVLEIVAEGIGGFLGELFGFQEGGKIVPRAYNNGIPIIAGEQNEGEFKLNERELKEIGKDTTVTIQYNGSIMSRNDFKTIVQDAVSDVSNRSRFR